MHHGSLTVASAGTGRGATFTLTLDTIAPPTGDLPATAGANASPAKARRILLVEDHEDTLRVMARLLRSGGHAVSTAASVQAALDVLDSQSFDLIISDLGLPDGSGLELIRQVKLKQPIHSIALSGFGMDEDVQRSLEAGFDVHLTKPVNLGMLETAIRGLTQWPVNGDG
jgi:CheY-like chemotaxis protein